MPSVACSTRGCLVYPCCLDSSPRIALKAVWIVVSALARLDTDNADMIEAMSTPSYRLERVLDAYRRGFRDKLTTISMVDKIRGELSPCEANEFRKALVHLFEVSEMESRQDSGYVINMAVLALCCLGGDCPFEKLLDLVASRFPIGHPEKIQTWSREIVPELQWILSSRPDLFSGSALLEIKTFATRVREKTHIYPPVAVSAIEQLERTADFIEYQNFEENLLGRSVKPEAIEASRGDMPRASALSPVVARALDQAADQLRSRGEFDPKTAADLIRGAMDEAHRVFVSDLRLVYGGQPTDDSDGARRAFMRDVGFITKAEEKFFSAIYSLISQEASHKLIAPRETVLLLHNTVFNYLLLLTERLKKERP